MKYEALFHGWWIVESLGRDDRYCYDRRVRQICAGEARNLFTHKGPFPTRERAEDFAYWDQLPGHWEHGLTVWADHCLNCGWFAKVLAFDNSAGWAWRVTECVKCGVHDSRIKEAAA